MQEDLGVTPSGPGSRPSGGADKSSPAKPSIPNATGIDHAIKLAAILHGGQRDKAGEPYILHPLRVMLQMKDNSRRIAALLHDTVEDCNITLAEIRERFGDAIADAVDALTRRDGESYMDFIERCGANEIARDVKRADLADNMCLSRLPAVTKDDLRRQEKYKIARARLNAIAIPTDRPRRETGSVHG